MEKQTDYQRYFLAIIPPEPIFSEAQNLKEYFKEVYNSKASLNSPPHITLHMPFRWKEKKEKLLIEKLSLFASHFEFFTIEIENFKAFPPRVIYIDILASDPLLALQKKFRTVLQTRVSIVQCQPIGSSLSSTPYSCLSGFKKEMFAKAWEEFNQKEYHQTFTCNSIALLKHDDKVWNVLAEFNLIPNSHKTIP